jgi:hypothetical protein
MTEWQPMLRHVGEVTPLNADETESIRTAMLAEAARSRSIVRERSHAGTLIGGVLAVAVAAGLVAARSVEPTGLPNQPSLVRQPEMSQPAPAPTQDLRQLQFATPGGTRIIWEFDPQFSLREQTTP